MAKVDLKLNPPENKRTLTKENMLSYVKNYGSEEDKAWFVELMNGNKLKRINNLDENKAEVSSYNYEIVREEFAKRFFPNVSKKAKKEAKKETKKKNSFEDELAALLK